MNSRYERNSNSYNGSIPQLSATEMLAILIISGGKCL